MSFDAFVIVGLPLFLVDIFFSLLVNVAFLCVAEQERVMIVECFFLDWILPKICVYIYLYQEEQTTLLCI